MNQLCVRWTILYRVLALLPLLFWVEPLAAENCEPIRACDSTRDCTPVDNRDCEPHWNCPNCQWYQIGCDAQRVGCEADKKRYKDQCEAAKAAQNATYAAARPACEGQKTAEKTDCERVKTTERLACEAGLAGPWRCSAQEVMLQLRTAPQEALTDFDELAGAVTTPIKNASGQLSWRDTACIGSGIGIPYRNSQRSTDGFCTIDVKLTNFSIEGVVKPRGDRFIRLEVHPGGAGASLCAAQTISPRDTISFSGPIRKDRHLG